MLFDFIYGFDMLEQRETCFSKGFEHEWKLLWRAVLVALREMYEMAKLISTQIGRTLRIQLVAPMPEQLKPPQLMYFYEASRKPWQYSQEGHQTRYIHQ